MVAVKLVKSFPSSCVRSVRLWAPWHFSFRFTACHSPYLVSPCIVSQSKSKTNNPNIEQRPPVIYQTLSERVSEAEAGEIIRFCIGLRIWTTPEQLHNPFMPTPGSTPERCSTIIVSSVPNRPVRPALDTRDWPRLFRDGRSGLLETSFPKQKPGRAWVTCRPQIFFTLTLMRRSHFYRLGLVLIHLASGVSTCCDRSLGLKLYFRR